MNYLEVFINEWAIWCPALLDNDNNKTIIVSN